MSGLGCRHHFRDPRGSCPRPPAPDGELCPWHNPTTRKDQLYAAELLRAEFEHSRGDLDECHLQGLIWPGAQLPGVRLARADLRDAQLPGADLTGAVLNQAILRRANLSRAILTGAQLSGADLSECNLRGADLRDADLSGCKLNGTVLMGADLRNADLKDAEVEDFQWNRLTRFAGVRGLEARLAASSTDETQRFIAPVALGQHEVGDASRGAFQPDDPEWERTRVYRPAAGSGLAPPGPDPALLERLEHLRRANRRWSGLAAAAVLVAGIATALVVALPDRPSGSTAVTVGDPTIEPAGPEDSPDRARQIAAILSERDQARQSAERAEAEIETARAQIRAAEERQRNASAEAARLRGVEELAQRAARQVSELSEERDAERARSRRIEATAAILAEGVRRLESERDLYRQRSEQQLVSAASVEALQERLDRAAGELSGTKQALALSQERNTELVNELSTTARVLERFVQRVQGTRYEDWVGGGDGNEALMDLEPGRTLIIGGSQLLTLTVSPAETGSVHINLLVQGRPGENLPDLGVVLYDQQAQPMRKLSFAFPGATDRRGMASLQATVPVPVFPRHARLLIAPADDARLTAVLP